MKYVHRENGKVASVISENHKYNTVTLELQDGSIRDMSISTLKRWWKKLPEEPAEEVPVEEKIDLRKSPFKIKDENDLCAESLLRGQLSFLLETAHVDVREWRKNNFAIRKDGKPYMEIRITKTRGFTIYTKLKYLPTYLSDRYSTIEGYYMPIVVKGLGIEEIKFFF